MPTAKNKKTAATKLKKWKTLDSRPLLKHDRLTVLEDDIQLPDGTKTTYLRFASSEPSVAIIAINNAFELLVQKEYSYPVNTVMWQLPGGGVEPGEEIERAALRELSEESGYSAHNTEILGEFYLDDRRSDRKLYVILCTDLYEHKLTEDPEEFVEAYWLSRDEVVAKISNGEFAQIHMLAALNLWFVHAMQRVK
jgi:ADP-ribose pyrophosphatase